MTTPNRNILTHQLERTPEAQREFEKRLMDRKLDREFGAAATIDWGDDADEAVAPMCDLENPESCESCT